jgi:excisionase family DNA binding protein
MTGLDELLTADEVAELLHITRSTVSDHARRGVLPSIKLGRHRRSSAPTSRTPSSGFDSPTLVRPTSHASVARHMVTVTKK